MGWLLGIDVGNTSTAAASVRDGESASALDLGDGRPTMASVVYVGESGERFVGADARARGAESPGRIAGGFERRLVTATPAILAGQPYDPAELMATIAAAVYRVACTQQGSRPDHVTLTHRVNAPSLAIDRLRAAAADALPDGQSLSLLPDAEAAAAHAATIATYESGDAVAVYDFGGGGLGVSILRRSPFGFEVVGRPGGAADIGGVDIDAALCRYVVGRIPGAADAYAAGDATARQQAAALRVACADAKVRLSQTETTSVSVEVGGATVTVELSRADLAAAAAPLVARSVEHVAACLESARMQAWELQGLLALGGVSRLAFVAEAVAGAAETEPQTGVDPKLAVALGAAVIGPARHAADEARRYADAQARRYAPSAPAAPSAPPAPPVPPRPAAAAASAPSAPPAAPAVTAPPAPAVAPEAPAPVRAPAPVAAQATAGDAHQAAAPATDPRASVVVAERPAVARVAPAVAPPVTSPPAPTAPAPVAPPPVVAQPPGAGLPVVTPPPAAPVASNSPAGPSPSDAAPELATEPTTSPAPLAEAPPVDDPPATALAVSAPAPPNRTRLAAGVVVAVFAVVVAAAAFRSGSSGAPGPVSAAPTTGGTQATSTTAAPPSTLDAVTVAARAESSLLKIADFPDGFAPSPTPWAPQSGLPPCAGSTDAGDIDVDHPALAVTGRSFESAEANVSVVEEIRVYESAKVAFAAYAETTRGLACVEGTVSGVTVPIDAPVDVVQTVGGDEAEEWGIAGSSTFVAVRTGTVLVTFAFAPLRDEMVTLDALGIVSEGVHHAED